MKKVLIATVSVLVIGGCAAAVSGGEDTEAPASSVTTEATPASDAPEEEAEPKVKPIKVNAKALIKEFEGNEAAADAKYKGKVLKVNGVVSKVDTDVWNDDEYIINVNGGGEWEFLTVSCPGQSADVAAKVKTGSRVTLLGTFDDGGDLGITLKDCSLV